MDKKKTIANVGKHAGVWLLNYWLIAFATDINWIDFTNASGSLAYAYVYGLVFNITLFYAQVFWLVPNKFMLNEKVNFFLFSFSLIAIVSLIETCFDYMLYGIYSINTRETFLSVFVANTIIHVLYSVAGFYYIFKVEHKKSEKIRQTLLEESYKTELKYLKAQLNPHFLFNGINSIYHLIGKDNALAKDTLLQFSGLLRYQLYESGTHISLEKELDYILQYIKIEETRRGSDIRLQYDIEFESSAKKIAPLLLIPFIENAFKHCSHHIESDMNVINIKILEIEGKLTLSTANSFGSSVSGKLVGGVGLKNVERRLELLYPNRYQLEMRKEKLDFVVDLSINL